MLTIPYEEGWRIEVDGRKAECIKLLDTFIGINLGKGEHIINLKYTPPKIDLGILLSILGIMLYLTGLELRKKYKRKK